MMFGQERETMLGVQALAVSRTSRSCFSRQMRASSARLHTSISMAMPVARRLPSGALSGPDASDRLRCGVATGRRPRPQDGHAWSDQWPPAPP